MKIKKIISQYRQDFTAIYECEHCSDEFERSGYADLNFHKNVIPKMKCKSCGKDSYNKYQVQLIIIDEFQKHRS